MNDGELARRCRRGDADAWRALVRRISPLVYRISVRVLGRGAAAEDAGQEALMQVYRAFARFDPTRPIEPWVARITYNVCLKQLGKRGRPGQPSDEPDALDRLPDEADRSPEEALASSESAALVAEALERLSPEDRVLVTLTYQDGMSNSEVAEAMDMPIGTVKTRLYRARARLRRWLSPRLRRRDGDG